MLSSGQVLRERYRVQEPFSAELPNVFHAYDTVENRSCVIKVTTGDEAARLEREAETLASHHHPNLPLLYDHFKDATQFYIILESPEGETLQAYIRQHGKLKEEQALTFMRQILSVFDYIHALNLPMCRGGFVPAHIWVADDDLKIYGAGVTEITAITEGERSLFCAPERGDDQRADVYSAAAVLYTMLTDHAPEFSSPRKYNNEITLATAQIILRAITHRPEARYATIREMRKALGRAKQRPEQVQIALRENPRQIPMSVVAILIGVAAMLLLLSASWIWNVMTVRANTPPTMAALTTGLPPTAPAPSPTMNLIPTATATEAVTPAIVTSTPTRAPSPTPSFNLGATAIAPKDQAVLIFIPAGEFEMGSNDNDPEAAESEKPRHKINLVSYWIDKTEITNRLYQLCMEAGACTKLTNTHSALREDYFVNVAYAEHPVIWVKWEQAEAYCKWAGRRLPTEREWEKAARGTDGRLYPWGSEPPNNTLLNYNLAVGDTVKVGSYPTGASPYGVLDMSGNVVEWVSDFYYPSYFPLIYNPTVPPPPLGTSVHSLRSSSWAAPKSEARVTVRHFTNRSDGTYNNVGFRCAATEKP